MPEPAVGADHQDRAFCFLSAVQRTEDILLGNLPHQLELPPGLDQITPRSAHSCDEEEQTGGNADHPAR